MGITSYCDRTLFDCTLFYSVCIRWQRDKETLRFVPDYSELSGKVIFPG